MEKVIVLLALLGVLLIIGLATGMMVSRRRARDRRRIAVINSSATMVAGGEDKDKQLARQRADIARKLKEAEREEKEQSKKDKTTIKEMLEQAGYETPVSRYWIYAAVFAFAVYLFLNIFTAWPTIAVFFATFTAFLGAPRFYLKRRAARRQRKFLEEFPDALDAAVRLLQAGMPIAEAVAMVSREFIGPLKEEMTRIYENQRVGVTLGAAALETARRIPLTEVHMFATALQIQSETGSSLSEVLSNLSAVIRARFRLKRKVRALSSEAKASAAIIAALPVLVTFGLKLANPEYIAILYTTPTGKLAAGFAVGWMLTGVFIMRQMINFRV